MKKRNYIYNFKDTAGTMFEEAVSETIKRHVVTTYGEMSFEESDMHTDQDEGTDFTIYRDFEPYRFDPTLDFNRKNKMKVLKETLDLDIGTVRFGIRYGNGAIKFEEPVIVLGFDIDGVNKHNAHGIVRMFKDQIGQIVDMGINLYQREVLAA